MAISPDPGTKARLESLFPLLARTKYAIRSGPSNQYNCISWALGLPTLWCWPDSRSYWPIDQRSVSLDCFIQAFAALGFVPTPDPVPEGNDSRIALYLADGRPTHAAKIETASLWTSKLGRAELIEHESTGLNGLTYGLPTHYFRKHT